MEKPGARVNISGDVHGQVVVGDHNIVVSAQRSVVSIATAGQRPECRRRDALRLLPRRARSAVGRAAELLTVTEGLAVGGPVQVHGQSGLGKSTLLRMAAHQLDDGPKEVVFLDAASREVGDVLQEIFEACYEAPGYRPSVIEARRLLSDIEMILVLDDLECDSDELDALLDTVSAARVLHSATERSLWGEGRALALGGLTHPDTMTLLAQQLGRPLRTEEQPVGDALWRATAGTPRRLVRAVVEERLRFPAELAELLPALFDDLAPNEQEIVSLLDLAGAGGVSDVLLQELATSADEMTVGCERLTTMGLIVPTARGYRISSDVDRVLPARLRLGKPALAALCDQLRVWLRDPDRSPSQVAEDGALITAAIAAAARVGAPRQGAQLAQAAAPAAALSLRLGVWGRVVDHGRVAAAQARDDGILAYLTHEDGVRSLVTGKRLAASAAFAAAAEMWRRLGDFNQAGAAEDAQEFCRPDDATSSPPDTQDGGTSAEPTSGDAGQTTDSGFDLAPDVSHGLPSASPVDSGAAAVGAKAGMSLTAKLVIGGGLATVTAGGLVLGERALDPETVPLRVTVSTSVVEVTMPGERRDGCLIRGGSTDCTTVVTPKKGTRGPIQIDPSQPLPDGVSILYWGCDGGPEKTSCTVRAKERTTVCVSTTSPSDRLARQECAEATNSPPPIVRTEVITVVPVNARGKPRPGYTVTDEKRVGTLIGCVVSPASMGQDIVWCAPNAAVANVCWVGDERVTVLCGEDPWEKRLRHFSVDERIPPTGPASNPIPWGMELVDGTRCRLRSGGAWGPLPEDLVGVYWCHNSSLIVVQGSRTPLLDTSAPGWTVQVIDESAIGRGDDTIPPRREITKVYYAGNHASASARRGMK